MRKDFGLPSTGRIFSIAEFTDLVEPGTYQDLQLGRVFAELAKEGIHLHRGAAACRVAPGGAPLFVLVSSVRGNPATWLVQRAMLLCATVLKDAFTVKVAQELVQKLAHNWLKPGTAAFKLSCLEAELIALNRRFQDWGQSCVQGQEAELVTAVAPVLGARGLSSSQAGTLARMHRRIS